MDSISKGKKTLLFTLIGFLISTFVTEVYSVFLSSGNLLTRMPRFLIICLLCFFIFMGSKIAKYFFIIFFGLFEIFMVLSMVMTFDFYFGDIVFVIAYAVTTFILITNKNVKEYFLYKKTRK